MSTLQQDDGNYLLRPKGFGGFNAAGVTAIAAALTATSNPMQGVNGANPEAIEQEANKFRKKVQEYAQAMEPLQDVFGRDME